MEYYLKPINSRDSNYNLGEYTTFGSALDCTLSLNHNSVSERHARIEKREGNLVLKDMRSQSGTFLNEARILEALLQNGDQIRIGPYEFQVCSSGFEKGTDSKLSSRNKNWQNRLNTLPHIAATDFPVLLLGPSGTGKDIIAKEIHQLSPRSKEELICVNCSALTETLIESELFGHVKGSFTGAIQDRKGAFESARGGTLFLDEIGDLPYSLQAKLLRALENNEIRPVGSDRTIKTDVRVIAATHHDLTDRIQLGQFRSDLYYRLNVIQLCPPALVDRMEDFEIILMSFAKKYRVRFSISGIHRLKKHNWPGNIREVKNLVARTKALYPGQEIGAEEVESLLGFTKNQPSVSEIRPVMSQSLPVIKEMEKQMIIKRLSVNRGNQRLTALDLGLPKSTLHDRLKDYSIDIKLFKV
ncbi:MAG: sigma 54-interacting transcriptional regulator [Bdellovibrionales bacterium]